MVNWGWREVKLFIRFFVYSVSSLGAVIALWAALDLPQVSSKTYVDSKIHPIQGELRGTRLQVNKLTRQNLEGEKWRLTNETKTNSSFDIVKRLKDIEEELTDTQKERNFLLNRN